jgi:F0F1-type ATP synthase assembly protein I
LKANNWLRYADIGLRLTVLTVFLVGGGVWADKHWQTSPWFTLLGIFMALGLLMRTVLNVGKKNDAA